MSGLSLIVDHNIFHEGEVTVLVALPRAYAGEPQKVITSTVDITYAIHSTRLRAYKIGMAFLKFNGNSEELLEAALAQELQKRELLRLEKLAARARAGRIGDTQLLG